MVDQIAVVSFDTPASPGTVDVTDPSLTETFVAAIFIYGCNPGAAGVPADSTDHAHAVFGMGFLAIDAGAAQEETAYCIQCEDGLGTTPECRTRHTAQGNCIVVVDGTNGLTQDILGRWSTTVIPNGVRLNFVGTTRQARVTAILFAGISRGYADLCTASVGGTHEDTGGTTDFEPDLAVFNAGDSGVSAVDSLDASPNLGFAINRAGTPQVCAYVNADFATEPTDADGFLRSDSAYAHGPSRTAGALNEATVSVAFDSTGFTATSSAGSPDAHYLAIKFGSASVRLAVANMAVAGSTGLQAFNDFGFTPDLVLGMSTLLTSVDTEIDGATASCSGYFITGKYGSRAITWQHEEGITLGGGTVSDAHTRQEDVAYLQYDHQGNVVQRATWAGQSSSGGFLLNFSTASQAGYMTALGIQINYEAPRTQYKPRRARLRQRVRKVKPPTILGRSAGQAFPDLWRAVRRFRDVMRERLFRRPSVPLLEPVDTTPSAAGQKAEGDVFSAGAERGDVVTGGADAGGVF